MNALASSFGDGTVLNSEIAWNFGDPGSAYNTLVGFNVAHAYADPGTYTITLTITTPDGQVGVATQQVTVSQDNRTTIYVSPNGNDSNNGLSQSTAIQSIARLNQLLTSNMSVLFQAGGTYTLGTSEVVNLSGLQHVLLGSYGSGAQPVLYYDGVAQGGTFIGLSSSSQGIVVEGLTFDSIFVDNDDKQAIPSGIVTQGNDISILNNTFLNLADDLLQGGQPATNVLVQGNNSPSVDDLSGYFYYMGGGSNIVVVGNTVAGSSAEAVLREAGATNLEVAGNNFTEPAAAGTTSGKAVLSIQEGEYAYIYDNTISNGPAQTGPIGTPQANPSGIFQYAVYDSNTLVNGASFVISPNAINIMYKNNVVIGNGITGFTINAQEVWGSFDWQAQNIYIEYNTVTDPSGASGGFLSINNGEASNVYLDNNLFYDPGFLIGEAAFIKVDENDLSSFAQIQNNVWPVPVDLSQSWEQGGAFFVSANASLQSGWLSPAEWEATGLPTGDVYQNVDLGATYQVTVNGITAGSNLPIA